MMLSGALFVLASVLIIVLLWVFNSLKLSRNNIQSLQENLDHSRSKLADYETQVDELNYEMTQLRMQLGSARTELNKYKQYQDICDIEQYIINRSLQAENFVEVTKLDASIMLMISKPISLRSKHIYRIYRLRPKLILSNRLEKLYRLIISRLKNNSDCKSS